MSAWLALFLGLLAAPRAQEPDDAAIRRLVEPLGAEFLGGGDAARHAREKIGKKGEDHLIRGLASNDHRIRRNCIELLAAFKSVKAMERAAEVFRSDEDASVRDAAFKLLQALGKDAEEHLIAALDSPALEHRRGAIQSLMDFKSEKCAEKMAALHEREPDMQTKALAFQCLQALAYQPFLLRCLKSPDAALRRDAFNGLAKAQGENVLAAVGELFAIETDPTVLDRAYNYLRDAKEKAQP